ncbi:hypothetical protein JNB11_02720 [Kocuria palustris]|nr:hypothetical protein [Kocuria palustris]
MTDEENNRLCSILPSYHMYNSLYKTEDNTDSDSDDVYQLPPVYLREDTPAMGTSVMATPVAATPAMLPIMTPQLGITYNVDGSLAASVAARLQQGRRERPNVVANENLSRWRQTMLDNVHRLENLLQTSNPHAQAISMEVCFTRDLCELGREPIIIDPSLFEYNKGDFLNGYITIENKLSKPVPFDMFYVVFEGTIRIKGTSGETKVDNFLSMFDFSASFNAAQINRLDTDENNPFAFNSIVDPLDGSCLSFLEDRLIHPGKRYKRFFTFKIPWALLDTKCENDISDHVQLPPTFGGSVVGAQIHMQRPPLSRQNLAQNAASSLSMLSKDLAGPNTSITYGVLARFIGRKLKYGIDKAPNPNGSRKLVNSRGDEYIILQEETGYVRVIQRSESLELSNFKIKQAILNQQLANIESRVQEVIQEFQRHESTSMDGLSSMENALEPVASTELAKERQLYRQQPRQQYSKTPDYQEQVKILTKLVGFGTKRKPYGTLRMHCKNPLIRIDYIPTTCNLLRQPEESSMLWAFDINLDFGFLQSSGSTRCPEFKELSILLVAQTYTTRKYPIPMEFALPNVLDIQSRCRKLAQELRNVKQQSKDFAIETQLISDVWALCDLEIQSKELFLRPPLVKQLNLIKWDANKQNPQEFSKSFVIPVDLKTLQLTPVTVASAIPKTPAYDRFCLVPSFQSCYVGRYYYLKVTATTSGEIFENRIPVFVNKPNNDGLWLAYKQYLLKATQSKVS